MEAFPAFWMSVGLPYCLNLTKAPTNVSVMSFAKLKQHNAPAGLRLTVTDDGETDSSTGLDLHTIADQFAGEW